MAIIQHAQSHAAAKEAFRAMAPAELMAQQLVMRGAIDALSTLIVAGCTPAMAAEMLESVQQSLSDLHEVANARGVQLLGYQAP
jgi:hypothetical protein